MYFAEQLTPLDIVFSPIYQNVFKHKPLEWYFTNDPDILAYDVIDEFMDSKAYNSQKENAERMINDLRRHLVKLIIEKKEREKQLTLITTDTSEPFREKVLQELKDKFPLAFRRRFKKTRNRYGFIQATLDLTKLKPVRPLIETMDFSDSVNNPLMFI